MRFMVFLFLKLAVILYSIYYSFRACSCIRYSDITPNVRSYIIWSRKGISAAVGLTETQFVELCLSLGNEAIPAALLNAVGPGRAEDIFDLMKDSELNFRRSAEDDITASRLMEIRCALEQEVRKDITRNESEDKSVLMVLPIAVEDALEDLLEVEDCSNFKIVATNFAAVCPSVSQAHAAALIGVSSIIEESRHRKNCCSDKDFSMPAWDIYHSAVYFQLVYRLWRKHAIRFGQTVDIIQAPRDVFSCSIYFAILNGLIELAPEMPVPSRDNFSSEMTDAYSSMEHLPIDSHKADILAKIARDRVVLIHGEVIIARISNTVSSFQNLLRFEHRQAAENLHDFLCLFTRIWYHEEIHAK